MDISWFFLMRKFSSTTLVFIYLFIFASYTISTIEEIEPQAYYYYKIAMNFIFLPGDNCSALIKAFKMENTKHNVMYCIIL
jgi:hypothetical protein